MVGDGQAIMRLVKLFGILSGLSGTFRFSNAKLTSPESVLEHTGGACLTCYFLIREIQQTDPDFLDAGEIMMRAAIHDVEELLIGDVPRVTKHADAVTRGIFDNMGRRAMEQITEDLEISSGRTIRDDHFASKIGRSGIVVKLSDALAVVYKCHEERERGNRQMIYRA